MRQQQHKIQTCVAFLCALRLLWTLAVAERSVRTFQEDIENGERETWRRHAASTGAPPPVNLDILSDSEARRDPTRPAFSFLDIGTQERCTRGSLVFSCGSAT